MQKLTWAAALPAAVNLAELVLRVEQAGATITKNEPAADASGQHQIEATLAASNHDEAENALTALDNILHHVVDQVGQANELAVKGPEAAGDAAQDADKAKESAG